MPIGTGGGRNLGYASGAIRIDTSETERAAVTVRRVGQDIKRSLNEVGSLTDRIGQRIGRGLSSVGSGLRSFSNNIRAVRTELAAVGVAAGVLTAIGLRTAGSFEEAAIQLKGMTGSIGAANALMDSLRVRAAKAGLPFEDMLTAARQLLPTLEGNTEELDKWIPLVQRLAVLNRREGLAGAAFSINEAISSGGTDLVSLAERFNISRTQLRQALEETGGDFAAALDAVLTKMGITQQTADEMGQTFNAALNRARDSAGQLLAAGFQPLLEIMTPILQQTADWLNRLRETSPEIARLGSGLLGVTTVGAPLLIFLGQAITMLEKIRTLSITATLGKAGVLAGAVVGGAAIGNVIGRGIGAATGNEGAANTQLSDVGNIVKQLIFLAMNSLTQLIVIIQDLVLRAVQAFVSGIAAMVNGMAGFVRTIGEILPDSLGGDRLTGTADDLNEFAVNIGESAEQSRVVLGQILTHGRDELMDRLQGFLFPSTDTAVATTTGAGGAGATGGVGGFSDEQTGAIVSWWEQIRELEATQAQARLDAAEQYEEQRTELITNYGRQQAREEEDFLRQRARQNEQFVRDVARISQERIKRESEWLSDLNEQIDDLRADSAGRVAEMREAGNDRILEIEEDYQRDRERAAEEHQNNLLSAASRLDARAIADEQRRFGLQESQAGREFASRINDERAGLRKRIEQEQENLAERIQQEQEAHEERILAAREADEERIADMRESLAEQQRLEDEDRAIRLRRIEDDHRRQLRALETANRDRLQEMDGQATKELTALNRKFQQELAQMGLASARQLSYQRKAQNDALKEFQTYWDDWNDVIKDQSDINPLKDSTKTTSKTKGFASGGVVDYTGLANVHGSAARPEYMLDANTTAALRGMMGNFNQAQLLGAVAGGRSTSLTLADGAIQVFAAPGQSEQNIAFAVRSELEGLFRGLAG